MFWKSSRVLLLAGSGVGVVLLARAYRRRSPKSQGAGRSPTLARPKSQTHTCAFVGLGAMGYHMAGHIAKYATSCIVWNRNASQAARHNAEHGGSAAATLDEVADGAQIIFMCLPTTKVVEEVIVQLRPRLRSGQIIVDCTSGDPEQSRQLAEELRSVGVQYVDAPISGGPHGAAAGTLTCMVGGDTAAVESVKPFIETFSKHCIHLGPVGSGHATKSINNALNVTHLLLASEGLLALSKFGVSPAAALQVINTSSGRSLQTQERIPTQVLTRKFAYGFKVSLMAKDVGIACGLLAKHFPGDTYFAQTQAFLEAAVQQHGANADYTEAVKVLETSAGAELA